MKCLVTGGVGFIGSHLVKKLIWLGHEIIVIDNFSGDGNFKLGYLKDIENKINMFKVDICKFDDIEKYFIDVDVVFHLAALKNVRNSFYDPDSYVKTNVIGTINCIKASIAHKVKRFIYSSSSSIYGGKINPKTLNHTPSPESIYGMTKYGGEMVCNIFSRYSDIRVCILRYFNVFGEHGNGIINLLLDNQQNGIMTKIYGDGYQSRDYTHIDNVIKANIEAGFNLKYDYEIFNVGCGQKTSLNELIKIMNIDKANIEYVPAKQGDVFESYADIKKTERQIYKGYTINLNEGIILLKNE